MNFTFDVTLKNRLILKQYLERLSLDDLNKIPSGFNNNIFWNIAHTLVTQQLLTYGLTGEKINLTDQMIASYRKGSKPDHQADEKERDQISTLLFKTLEQTEKDYKNGLFKNYKSYTTSLGITLNNIEDALQFNNFHEGLHLGYIQALNRAINV